MRIVLEIRHTQDIAAAKFGHRLFIYRLWPRVRFRQAVNWSEDHLAIVDTGAPYPVIPASLWPMLKTRRILDTPLRGIVPGESAQVRASLGKVTTLLFDSRNASRPFRIHAMLVRAEPVPLILGWAGFLDRSKLVVHPRQKTAWLEL